MGFNDPIVGGSTLIRPSIQSPNYAAGSSGWTVNEDGSAEFNNLTSRGQFVGASATFDTLNINKEMYYKGDELTVLLDKLPKGIVAAAYRGQTDDRNTTSSVMLVQTPFIYDSSRHYRFWMSPVRMYSGTAGGHTGLYLVGRAASGGNLTTADPSILLAEVEHERASEPMSRGFVREFNPLSDANNWVDGTEYYVGLRMDCLTSWGAGPSHMNFDTLFFAIEDMGKRIYAPAGDLYTAPATPQVVQHQFQIGAYDSRSYQQGGAQSAGSGSSLQQRMYTGYDQYYTPNGNWRSYAWFDQPTLAGMANATKVDYCDIFVNNEHWYYNSGGTLVLGWHGNSSVTSTENLAGGQYNVVQKAYGTAPSGQWISVMGTAIETAILNGSFRGIVLGPGPTNDLTYYGYNDGQGGPYPPAIRASYWK